MENQKSNKGFIIILIIIILGLGGYLVYDKVIAEKVDSKEETITKENKETKTKENEKDLIYTYSEIKGLYTANIDQTIFNLYLYENGTFSYNLEFNTHGAVGGNYIIVDDTIKLNYLFWEGNGAGLGNNSGSNTLKINKDGSLTNVFSDEQADKALFTSINGSDSITLTKADSTKENEFLETNKDVTAKIEQYGIYSPNAQQ